MKSKKLKLDGETIRVYYLEELKQDFENQIYEIWHQECYKSGRRKKNTVYLDLGANIGIASLYFRKWAKVIYALEPNPEIFEVLKKNTERYDNINIFNIGVAPYTGRDFLYSDDSPIEAQTMFNKGEGTFAVLAEFVGLNDFFKENNIDHVDVMKMDIEGAEYVVLPSDSFSQVAFKIDFIIGETHFEGKKGFPDVVSLILKDYGFKTKPGTFNKKRFKNAARFFTFQDQVTGKTKEYEVRYNNIFVAER